jgi:diguanylate cyclase (GGDEF)-like protein
MMDLDHFKTLNDTLGHAAGDELLRSIAQIIRSTIRTTDHAFRWGGDEFAILCEATDATAARGLANRLTSLVDALAKTCRGVPVPPGLSIGMTTLDKGADPNPRSIIEAADRVLYEVKAARHSRSTRMAS